MSRLSRFLALTGQPAQSLQARARGESRVAYRVEATVHDYTKFFHLIHLLGSWHVLDVLGYSLGTHKLLILSWMYLELSWNPPSSLELLEGLASILDDAEDNLLITDYQRSSHDGAGLTSSFNLSLRMSRYFSIARS